MLKVLHYFLTAHILQTVQLIWLIFCSMIDIGPKAYLAIVPPIPLALSSRSRTEQFYVKVLHYFLTAQIFQTIRWIWLIFCMMTDRGPKIYSAIYTPMPMTLRSRSQTYNFNDH